MSPSLETLSSAMTAVLNRRELDLNLRGQKPEDLTISEADVGTHKQRRMAVLFLKLITLQTLSDEAIAFNLFYDAEDDCLRGVQYYSEHHKAHEDRYREYYPAPGCFAGDVLTELRWRIGVSSGPGEGRLYFRHDGERRSALAVCPSGSEVRIYLTGERPGMRVKGIQE